MCSNLLRLDQGVWALPAPAQAVFGEVGPEAWGSGLGWGGEGKRLVPGFV